MLALLIILGILGYILGVIIFIITDTVRMTYDQCHQDTFKLNLLDILNGNFNDGHLIGLCVGGMLWPIGIFTCLVMMFFILLDRTLIERLRKWCKS